MVPKLLSESSLFDLRTLATVTPTDDDLDAESSMVPPRDVQVILSSVSSPHHWSTSHSKPPLSQVLVYRQRPFYNPIQRQLLDELHDRSKSCYENLETDGCLATTVSPGVHHVMTVQTLSERKATVPQPQYLAVRDWTLQGEKTSAVVLQGWG
ncbi:hypothetical protein EI94DRAFT_1703319 [Lactarius quietus]|nr:hypothetical protein EI94DRAFT_1703319 [Lactarius quietus]